MKLSSISASALILGGMTIGFNAASCAFYVLDDNAPVICLYLWLFGALCGGILVLIGIRGLRTSPAELDSLPSHEPTKRWPLDKHGFVRSTKE